jgi:DNA-directed RNA polymerase subunit E'/Rpb7
LRLDEEENDNIVLYVEGKFKKYIENKTKKLFDKDVNVKLKIVIKKEDINNLLKLEAIITYNA